MNKTKTGFSGYITALIFVMPLFQSSAFVNRIITPKLYYFFFFLSFVSFIVLLQKWNTGKYNRNFKLKIADILILALPIYAFIRTITYENGVVSDQYFFTIIGLTVFYFLVKEAFKQMQNTGNTEGDRLLLWFFAVIVFTGLVEIIWGLLQLSGIIASNHPDFKITGSFDNPGPYAAYLATIVTVALLVLIRKQNKLVLRALSVTFITCCLIILPLTAARASWLGAVFSTGIVLLYRYKLNNKVLNLFRKKYMLAITIIIATVVIILVGNYLYHFKVESAQGRVFIWKNCTSIIKQKPIFGHGFNTYAVRYNEAQGSYFSTHPKDEQNAWLADNIEFAFNEYLQIAVELGIFGLIIFLSPVVYLLMLFFRRKNFNDVSILAIAILSCILIIACVSYPFRNLPVYINYYLCLGLLSGIDANIVRQFEMQKKNYRLLYLAGLFIIIVFASLQIKRFKAQKEWKNATLNIRGIKSQQAQKTYRELYPVLKHDKFYLYNYGAELSVLGQYKESIEILEETVNYLNDADTYIYLANSYMGVNNTEKAEEYLIKASFMMPGKFYPQYRLVLLYDQTGRKDEALKMAQKIVDRPVKITSQIVDNIKKEMQEYIRTETTK